VVDVNCVLLLVGSMVRICIWALVLFYIQLCSVLFGKVKGKLVISKTRHPNIEILYSYRHIYITKIFMYHYDRYEQVFK